MGPLIKSVQSLEVQIPKPRHIFEEIIVVAYSMCVYIPYMYIHSFPRLAWDLDRKTENTLSSPSSSSSSSFSPSSNKFSTRLADPVSQRLSTSSRFGNKQPKLQKIFLPSTVLLFSSFSANRGLVSGKFFFFFIETTGHKKEPSYLPPFLSLSSFSFSSSSPFDLGTVLNTHTHADGNFVIVCQSVSHFEPSCCCCCCCC